MLFPKISHPFSKLLLTSPKESPVPIEFPQKSAKLVPVRIHLDRTTERMSSNAPRSASSRPRASTLHQGEFASVVRLPRDASPAQFASPLLTVYQRPRAFLLFGRVSFNSFARPRGFIRATEDALPPSLSLRTPRGFIRATLSNLSSSNFSLA